MKNLFIALVVVSSASLFSCTTDDSDLVEETVVETETFISGGTIQILAEE